MCAFEFSTISKTWKNVSSAESLDFTFFRRLVIFEVLFGDRNP